MVLTEVVKRQSPGDVECVLEHQVSQGPEGVGDGAMVVAPV